MWQVVTAGLMTGASVTVRPTTLPLVLLVPVFLLLRQARLAQAGASLLAGLLPVAGYMGWFAAVHGSVNLTNSNGMFLWSRTMSFANCAVIQPPADLQALCPSAQPGHLAQPDPARRLPAQALPLESPDLAVAARALRVRAGHRRVHPGQQRPRAALCDHGHRARSRSATSAWSRGRPWSRSSTTNNLRFPTVQPHSSGPDRGRTGGTRSPRSRAYTGSDQGVAGDLGYDYGTRLKSPYVFLMNEYQHIVFLPGQVFALVVLTGLAGIILPRRRTAVAALLWASAIILMVLPIAEHEYTYRYVLPAVPLACIAAAMALRKPGQEAAQT